MTRVAAAVVCGVCFVALSSYASQLPGAYLNNVVALGNEINQETDPAKPPNKQWVTLGTGFFYAKLSQDDPDPQKRLYEIYLVTAKHVVEEYKTLRREKPALDDLKVRLNPKESSSAAQEFPVLSNPPSPDIPTWFYHPHNVDVAIVPVKSPLQREMNKMMERGLLTLHPGLPHDSRVPRSARDLRHRSYISLTAGDGGRRSG